MRPMQLGPFMDQGYSVLTYLIGTGTKKKGGSTCIKSRYTISGGAGQSSMAHPNPAPPPLFSPRERERPGRRIGPSGGGASVASKKMGTRSTMQAQPVGQEILMPIAQTGTLEATILCGVSSLSLWMHKLRTNTRGPGHALFPARRSTGGPVDERWRYSEVLISGYLGLYNVFRFFGSLDARVCAYQGSSQPWSFQCFAHLKPSQRFDYPVFFFPWTIMQSSRMSSRMSSKPAEWPSMYICNLRLFPWMTSGCLCLSPRAFFFFFWLQAPPRRRRRLPGCQP